MKKIFIKIFITLFSLSSLTNCSSNNLKKFYTSNSYNQYIVASYVDESKVLQYGAIDYKGNVVVDFNKNIIFKGNTGILSINEENNCYLLKNNKTISTNFKRIYNFDSGSAAVQDINGKYGIVNENFDYLIDPIFDNVLLSLNGAYFLVKDENNYFSYNGTYTEIDGSFGGNVFCYGKQGAVCLFLKDGLYGIVNNSGEVVVNNQYISIEICNDVAVCKTSSTISLINVLTKEELISIPLLSSRGSLNRILAFDSSYYLTSVDQTTTLYNNKKVVSTFEDGYYGYSLHNQMFITYNISSKLANLFNKNGDKLNSEPLSSIPSISYDGTKAIIKDNDSNYKVINSNGKVILEDDSYKILSYGLDTDYLYYEDDSTIGILNNKGKKVISLEKTLGYRVYDISEYGVIFIDESSNYYFVSYCTGNEILKSVTKLFLGSNCVYSKTEAGTIIYNIFGEEIYSSSHNLLLV